MDADGLRVHGDFGSATRNHHPLFDDAQSLPASFRRVAD